MGWRFTDNVEAFAGSAWGLLAGNPVEHTVALSVIESVRAGHRWSEHGQMVFGCYDDGEVQGAVSLTPPFELLLAVVPDDTVAELVAALGREGVRFPGVNGGAETVERFGAAWTSATGMRSVPVRQMRLYTGTGATGSRPPRRHRRSRDRGALAARVRGRGRGPGDQRRVLDAHGDRRRSRLAVGGRGAVRRGARESYSDCGGCCPHCPVYTPPDQRRRGYGAAATAACTEDALGHGARDLVLFTDLANPTSNSIYQQIGYVPVRDYHVVHFAAGAT